MPGYWDDHGTRKLHGIIWFRKEIIVLSSITGNKITISFTNTGSGLMVKEGDELAQFAIACEDKHFV